MDWLSIKEFLLDAMKYIIAIIVILFILTYIVTATQVVGSSMYPTFKDGELVLVNKFKYLLGDVKRGDIISLDYADTKYLIKRVIGVPGDDVVIKDNVLYINGSVYKEDYISSELNYEDFNLADLGYSKIPDDMYLVLGDNREKSLDSRDFGLIKKDDINGKISFRFWPLNRLKFF